MSHFAPARRRADDPRARDLPRRRGDLEGADAAAHAADVGHERDPRDRDRRRDPRRRDGRPRPAHGLDRLHRDDPRRRQRGRRLRRHRPDARDVQEARAAAAKRRERRGRSGEPDHLEPALPRHDHLLRPGAAVPLVADDGAARATGSARPGWRSRSWSRSRRPSVHIGWRIIVGGAIGAVVRSGRGAPREDDRDAADGGAVQRRRRRRGGARLARGVPQPRARAGAAARRRLARDRALGADRLGLVRGLDGRVREAAGADPAGGRSRIPASRS